MLYQIISPVSSTVASIYTTVFISTIINNTITSQNGTCLEPLCYSLFRLLVTRNTYLVRFSIRFSKSFRATSASARGTEVANCCCRAEISSRAAAVSARDTRSCSSTSSTVTLEYHQRIIYDILTAVITSVRLYVHTRNDQRP